MSFTDNTKNLDIRKNKNWKQQIYNREFLVKILIIIFLITTNFLIGAYLRPNLLNAMWYGDDAETINIANSFREHGNFTTTYLGDYIYAENSTSSLFEKYPIISQDEGGKGPIFYVLLGSFFKIFDVKITDLYFYGSVFANILTSIFLILFFFLIKKKFSMYAAFFSSLLILSCSYIAWHSARVDAMPLLNLFCIAALFFLEKKKLNYFIFGIIAGFAHLTHPFGIFLGITYATFLLINKEFKGFLIVILGWHLILLSWFLRNYFTFGDFGVGLYVPFSNKISSFLSFIPHNQYLLSNISYFQTSYIGNIKQHILSDILFAGYQNLGNFYKMDYLIFLLIVLVSFSFFKIEILRNKIKYVLIVSISIICFYFIMSYITNIYAQIVVVFIVPIFLVILLYSLKKQTLIPNLPRVFFFIPLFAYFNLIGYYYVSILLNYQVLETRQLMLSIILMVPLAIYALGKIMHKFNLQKNIIRSKVIFLIVTVLILFPVIFQMANGIESVNKFPFHLESSEIKSINNWIRNNIAQDQRIGSNFPLETTYRTGLESVALPDFSNQINFEKILDHFNISYMVLYDNVSTGKSAKQIHDDIIHSPISTLQYVDVYSVDNSFVIKVYNINADVNYKNKLLSTILENATRFEQQANFSSAIDSYEKLLYLFPDDGYKGLIRNYVALKKYDAAINSYDDYINSYHERITGATNQDDQISLQKSMIKAMYAEITLLINIGNYDKANDVCVDMISVNNFDKNAHLTHANILEKLGMHEDALREYAFANRLE